MKALGRRSINLTLNANVGYLHTSIDNGQSFVDQMNLTQGNPMYTLVKQTSAANCLALDLRRRRMDRARP